MIIFQRSMERFGRSFDQLEGDWLTKKPEGLTWLSFFKAKFPKKLVAEQAAFNFL